MLCGVTATLGSNPSATATAARPHWGRAVLLCLPDLWARSLGVPVGGGPPARSPHASLKARSGRSRGPPWPCRHPPAPRPGPATAHRHRGRSLRRPPHQWSLVCLRMVRRVGSLSGQALPPPMGTPAVPSGPSNVVCFVVLRFGDAPMRVVTNVVNRRCFSCGFLIRCYKRRQSDGFFAENQGFWTQIDDVCNMSTRKGVQIASV